MSSVIASCELGHQKENAICHVATYFETGIADGPDGSRQAV
jgi:hypothetical protein